MSTSRCSSATPPEVKSAPYEEPVRWVTLENLRRADIMAVLQRVVGVLVVSNFFPLEASEHGAEGVARLEQGAYSNAPEVGKAGNMPSVYEITGDTARQAYYFHEGPHVMQQFRAAFWPYMQPMDLVRVLLDGLFAAGAMLMNIPGMGKASVGLCRVMHGLVRAHRDRLEKDLGMTREELDRFMGYISQLAVNVYIKVPDQGGELQLWNVEVPDEQFDALAEGYGIHPTRLPTPDAIYKPEQGDLAFFNSRNLHAINAGTGGVRLSQSGFVKYAGDDKPLELWS